MKVGVEGAIQLSALKNAQTVAEVRKPCNRFEEARRSRLNKSTRKVRLSFSEGERGAPEPYIHLTVALLTPPTPSADNNISAASTSIYYAYDWCLVYSRVEADTFLLLFSRSRLRLSSSSQAQLTLNISTRRKIWLSTSRENGQKVKIEC